MTRHGGINDYVRNDGASVTHLQTTMPIREGSVRFSGCQPLQRAAHIIGIWASGAFRSGPNPGHVCHINLVPSIGCHKLRTLECIQVWLLSIKSKIKIKSRSAARGNPKQPAYLKRIHVGDLGQKNHNTSSPSDTPAHFLISKQIQ